MKNELFKDTCICKYLHLPSYFLLKLEINLFLNNKRYLYFKKSYLYLFRYSYLY